MSLGKQMERVILAAVQTEDGDDTRQSLAELRDLAETAGADAVATVIQNREAVHPATYLGKGKLEEIRELIYDLDATGVICDDELTPAQMNNLEQELECKIMDRTMVILDIFRLQSLHQRGKDSGGAGAAEVPGGPSGGHARLAVQAGRRDRHQRPR